MNAFNLRQFIKSAAVAFCITLALGPAHAHQAEKGKGPPAPVVEVAPPTGIAAVDVANIEAAVAAAPAGAIIQFGAGTYVFDADSQIFVETPGVTLLGDDAGTTIQGVAQIATGPFQGEFLLGGKDQTIRNLEFDGFRAAVALSTPGAIARGAKVQYCTFRQGYLGFELTGSTKDVATVSHNQFINVDTTYVIAGNTVHFHHNLIAIPDPDSTFLGRPLNAGRIFPDFFGTGIAEKNVIEHNIVIGQADGFVLFDTIMGLPAGIVRKNVIQDNLFLDQKIFIDLDDASMVVIEAFGGGTITKNTVKNNRLIGSEGIGIIVAATDGVVSDNKITNNVIEDLPGEKTPYRAIVDDALPGTGIFLNAGTVGNKVRGNEFVDVLNPLIDLGTNKVVNNEIDDHRAGHMTGSFGDASEADTARHRADVAFDVTPELIAELKRTGWHLTR